MANEVGAFTVVALQPGTYRLRIEHPGFKAYERREIVVSANERVALGDLMMQLGEVSETVSVTGEAAHVQTDSSEHSARLTTNQLTNLTARGREVVSMLRTIPGVQYQADQDSTGGAYGTGTPNIAGSFAGTNILAVDGVVSNDQGSTNVFSSVTTLDAIGEVKVLLNSYHARLRHPVDVGQRDASQPGRGTRRLHAQSLFRIGRTALIPTRKPRRCHFGAESDHGELCCRGPTSGCLFPELVLQRPAASRTAPRMFRSASSTTPAYCGDPVSVSPTIFSATARLRFAAVRPFSTIHASASEAPSLTTRP